MSDHMEPKRRRRERREGSNTSSVSTVSNLSEKETKGKENQLGVEQPAPKVPAAADNDDDDHSLLSSELMNVADDDNNDSDYVPSQDINGEDDDGGGNDSDKTDRETEVLNAIHSEIDSEHTSDLGDVTPRGDNDKSNSAEGSPVHIH